MTPFPNKPTDSPAPLDGDLSALGYTSNLPDEESRAQVYSRWGVDVKSVSPPSDRSKKQQTDYDMDLDDIELNELPSSDVASEQMRQEQTLSRKSMAALLLAVASCLLTIWLGCAVYLYYFWTAQVWVQPPVWFNTHEVAAICSGIFLLLLTAGTSIALARLMVAPNSKRSPSRPPTVAYRLCWMMVWVTATIVLAAAANFLVMAPVIIYSPTCEGTTPIPVYLTDGVAWVYSADNIKPSLVAQFSLSLSQTGSTSFGISQLDGSPSVLYDLSAGTATVPSLNATANFPSGSLAPIDFPSLDTVFESVGDVDMNPVSFSLAESNADGSIGVVFHTRSRSPTSCRTIKICAAAIPGADSPQLLVPLGLSMYYHFVGSRSC